MVQVEFPIHISLWAFQIRLANKRSPGIRHILTEIDGDIAFGVRKDSIQNFILPNCQINHQRNHEIKLT